MNHHIIPGDQLTGPALQQITDAFPLTPDVDKTRREWIASHRFYFSPDLRFLGVYREVSAPTTEDLRNTVSTARLTFN